MCLICISQRKKLSNGKMLKIIVEEKKSPEKTFLKEQTKRSSWGFSFGTRENVFKAAMKMKKLRFNAEGSCG